MTPGEALAAEMWRDIDALWVSIQAGFARSGFTIDPVTLPPADEAALNALLDEDDVA